MRNAARLALAGIVALFTQSGCDSFSLLAQFSLPNGAAPAPLALSVQNSTLQQGETINLYPSGGKEPYTFGVMAGSLYYNGTLGSIANEQYTAGTAIGTVAIQLTDALGSTAQAQVTIVPPTPANFVAAPVGTAHNQIGLSWSYANTALISGFLIQYSTDGVNFTSLPILGSSYTTYQQGNRNPNTTYFYRLYAVAGSFQSLPTPVSSTMP